MRRAYPHYRDSGVGWLGDIPAHWRVSRLERVASYSTSNVDKKTEDDELPVRLCNYTDVYYQDRIRASSGEYMQATASLHEIARFQLRVGDTLITKDSEDWKDIGVPALVEEAASDFLCGYHLGIIHPSPELHADFLFRAMQTTSVNRQLQVSASGVTRFGLPNAAVGEALLPWLPPLDEQHAIAAFLDRETARTDKLVEKNRLLIERLAEYRTTMITRAVTRGLDPSAPLKPSGIEWLGDIPEHWEVSRLQYIATYRTSNVDKKTVDGELAVRLCNYTDVYYRQRISASNGDYMEATASPQEIDRFSLSVGDVVITKDSENWQDIAVPALIEETSSDFVCSYHLGIIRPSPVTDPRYLFRAMQSGAVNEQLQMSASGVTRFGIPNGAVGDVILPIPPLSEQRTIADYLDYESERIDALTSRAEAAIERLQEYRSALITAAVTGKIDVREPE